MTKKKKKRNRQAQPAEADFHFFSVSQITRGQSFYILLKSIFMLNLLDRHNRSFPLNWLSAARKFQKS